MLPRRTPASDVAPREADGRRREPEAALHEVGNALTVVLGLIDRARTTDDAGERERLLGLARDRADDGRRLARVAIGARVDEAPDGGDLATVLREAKEGLVGRAASKEVALSITFDDGPLVASPRTFLQVLTNLLLNAVHFAPPGSEVRVACIRGAELLHLSVTDEGPGVPLHRRATLFAGGTTEAQGAGIGLAHARSLAREAGGDLTLGEGPSEFVLSWPTCSERSREVPSTPREVDLRGARCLVLDDDASILELLETALGHRGAATTSCATTEAAARALGEATFDVVLLDLSPFRKGDGPTLADIVAAAEKARAALLVVSGSADGPEDAVLPADTGHVRKPFEIRELVAAVERAFRLDKGGSEGP